MRTTLTLDEDVRAGLEKVQKARNSSFKAAVNETLRAGLLALTEEVAEKRARYVTEPWDAGESRLADLDDVAEVLAIAEGEDHR